MHGGGAALLSGEASPQAPPPRHRPESSACAPPPPPLHTRAHTHAVAQLCRRYKEQAIAAGAPRAAILPLLAALQRLQPSPEHLTPMHADVLQL
jgi:hypothetical protein